MGLYFGTNDLLGGGGGATEATTKEINGYTYSNVITNPKSNLFPVVKTRGSNTYTMGFTATASTYVANILANLGIYTKTSWSINTDETIVDITNATNGGFVHWVKTPLSGASATTTTLKITLDGTAYIWQTIANTTNIVNITAGGGIWQVVNQGFPASFGKGTAHYETSNSYPDVPYDGAYLYQLSPIVARNSPYVKLYFETSCKIEFNMSAILTQNNYETAAAGITLL